MSVPFEVPTDSGRPLEPKAVKSEMEQLRTRAIVGEDFNRLLQDAYQHLRIQATPPPVNVLTLRRAGLQGDEAKLFDLESRRGFRHSRLTRFFCLREGRVQGPHAGAIGWPGCRGPTAPRPPAKRSKQAYQEHHRGVQSRVFWTVVSAGHVRCSGGDPVPKPKRQRTKSAISKAGTASNSACTCWASSPAMR